MKNTDFLSLEEQHIFIKMLLEYKHWTTDEREWILRRYRNENDEILRPWERPHYSIEGNSISELVEQYYDLIVYDVHEEVLQHFREMHVEEEYEKYLEDKFGYWNF